MSVYPYLVLEPFIFVVLALAVARATVLLYDDDITQPIRDWVIEKCGTDGFWTRGIHCPSCVSMWFALAFVPTTYAASHIGGPIETTWNGFLTLMAVAATARYIASR